jgi:thiamine biosynthesis protein ThiS
MITVHVNGKERQLEVPMPLTAFLESLNLPQRHFAVAHNGVVLRRAELGGVTLHDGDQLEIVRAVGGGSTRDLRCRLSAFRFWLRL